MKEYSRNEVLLLLAISPSQLWVTQKKLLRFGEHYRYDERRQIWYNENALQVLEKRPKQGEHLKTMPRQKANGANPSLQPIQRADDSYSGSFSPTPLKEFQGFRPVFTDTQRQSSKKPVRYVQTISPVTERLLSDQTHGFSGKEYLRADSITLRGEVTRNIEFEMPVITGRKPGQEIRLELWVQGGQTVFLMLPSIFGGGAKKSLTLDRSYPKLTLESHWNGTVFHYKIRFSTSIDE